LECGSASYRLFLGIQGGRFAAILQEGGRFAAILQEGGSFAAALQGASRIFMQRGAPLAHEICARNNNFQLLFSNF
jgi:hypothetical protein